MMEYIAGLLVGLAAGIYICGKAIYKGIKNGEAFTIDGEIYKASRQKIVGDSDGR